MEHIGFASTRVLHEVKKKMGDRTKQSPKFTGRASNKTGLAVCDYPFRGPVSPCSEIKGSGQRITW